MLFYEPAVEPRRALKSEFIADAVKYQTRWSPPSTPRYKWSENSLFRSRFLSSSPPHSGNNQSSRNNPLYVSNVTTSTLNLNQSSDIYKGNSRVTKAMDHPNSNNEADSHQSNSLQLYNADRERTNPSMMGSPSENRREFGMARAGNNGGVSSMTPMHTPMQPGYAMGHPPGTKMLVDPVTGQQYFLPTAQPQVAYYPVFYNASPPQSQPIYYQAAPAPHGFFVPSQPPMPTSPSHHTASQPMFFQQHQSQQAAQQHDPSQMCHFSTQNMGGSSPPTSNITPQTSHNQGFAGSYSSPAYRVEIPPSNASVASSSYFQRNHESRVSTESGASSNSSRNKHSDDSMSPGGTHRSGVEFLHQYPQTHQQLHAKHLPENWPRNSSNRYSSATSSSSGFVSGDTTNFEKSRLSARISATSDLQTSPSHKTPQHNESPMRWWHSDSPQYAQRAENERFEFVSRDFCNDDRRLNRVQNRDSSASPKSLNESPPPPPPKPTQKAIRMDIDLSQPLVTEKASATEKAVVKANVTPPTAFTISFDDAKVVSEELPGRDDSEKTPLSLQDAARQAPTGRRLMRRSVPPSKASALSATDANGNQKFTHLQDPKEYLFSKMFEDCGKGTGDEMTTSHMSSNFGAKRETDTLSEAGTYIVENKNRQGMICSQIIDSDEESDVSSSTSSTISDNATQNTSSANGGNSRNLPQNLQKPTPIKSTDFGNLGGGCGGGMGLTSRPKNADGNSASPMLARRSLMSDLRKLREEKSLPSLTSIASTSPCRFQAKPPPTKPLLPTISSQKPTSNVFSTRLCQNQARPASGGGGSANVFRPSPRCHSETRADGGRFSMRSSAATSSSGYTGVGKPLARNPDLKPPFRTGVGNSSKQPLPNKNVAQMQDTPEMVAWLRRKEYDPRKAAAEAKKMQQLKQSLIKLANGYEKVLECEIGVDGGETDNELPPRVNSEIVAEDTYLANRSISYHNPGGFSSGANSAFQKWKKPMGDDRSNKSYDNLSHLGEENIDEFSHLSIGEPSNNLKRTVDALTQKCHKSIELIRLCNKSALSPSVENLLQSVVESSNPRPSEDTNPESGGEPSEKISERLERLSSAFDAIQKYLEEQSSSSSPSKVLGLMPRVAHDYVGSSTQKLLLDISELNEIQQQQSSHQHLQPFDSARSEGDLPSNS